MNYTFHFALASDMLQNFLSHRHEKQTKENRKPKNNFGCQKELEHFQLKINFLKTTLSP